MNKPLKPLDSDQWHSVMAGSGDAATAARRVEAGYVRAWYDPVLRCTKSGQTVIETGSGTGQLSGAIARNGRKTFLLDLSLKNLEFSRSVFKCAGIEGDFVQADILQRLPFRGGSFDCVFSHGVLEHFSEDEIGYIIKESARVAKSTVISIVPNAASLAYRIGKRYQENRGKWMYGRETPKYSLKRLFRWAGLVNIREYSIDPRHSFEFLTMLGDDPAGTIVKKTLNRIPLKVLEALNQGYLLVTVGEKRQEVISRG